MTVLPKATLPLLFITMGTAPCGAQWLAPRHTCSNTAFSGREASLVSVPVMRWRFVPQEGLVTTSYLAAGDLDGDGQPEIAVGSAPMGSGQESVGRLWIIDSGGVQRWSASLDGYVKWASPVMAPLDADSLPDVVVGASWWSSLFAFRGADGQALWTALEGVSQVGMNGGDLDGDGTTELVVADYQSPRHVRAVTSTGAIRWVVTTSGTTYNIPAIGILGDTRGVLFTAHAFGWRERLYFLDPQGAVVWTYEAHPTSEQLQLVPPELGYLPDYGYVSAVISDFDGDETTEVGFGTDLNYYVLESDGTLLWRQPTGILGNGFTAILNEEGDTVSYVDHHYQVMDAAVADLNGDGACDVVYGLGSDWWGRQVEGEPASLEVTRLVYRNALIARSGIDGTLLWRFDARHPCSDPRGIGRMGEPVACRIGGEVVLLAGSNDGYLYAVRGIDGQMLWELSGQGHLWRRGMALCDLDGDGVDELLVVRGGCVEAWSALQRPVLSVRLVSDGVRLSWSGDSATQEWQVFRGGRPWFLDSEAELVASLPARQTAFTDAALGFLLNPAQNAFYRVRAIAGEASSVPSNEVGEFDWGTTGGTERDVAVRFDNAATALTAIGAQNRLPIPP